MKWPENNKKFWLYLIMYTISQQYLFHKIRLTYANNLLDEDC